jgi:protein tyrosine/serine phosphatase
MTGVEQDYLEAAMDEIDQYFGGLNGYLEAAEITQQDISHLKSRLLEQSP